MSATKEMWMDEVERIVERAHLGPGHYYGLTTEEAVRQLVRLGIDLSEAHDMLDAAVS